MIFDVSLQDLYRLDELMWSMKNNQEEVRIVTPGFNNRSLDYDLASVVAEFLKKGNTLKEELDLSNANVASDLQIKWQFEDITQEWALKRQKGSPYDHNFFALPFKVIEVKPASTWQKISWAFSRGYRWIKKQFGGGKYFANKQTYKALPWKLETEQTQFLHLGAFNDPFTLLATEVLQQDETPFVAQAECLGSYCFILENGTLQLKALESNPSKDSMRAAVIAYRDFLKQAFGWRILDSVPQLFAEELSQYEDIFTDPTHEEEQLFSYLNNTFDIDFENMIKQNMPLFPDHIFKCNIGVYNIEMPQVESLYLRLVKKLKQFSFDENISLNTSQDFFAFFDQLTLPAPNLFSLREKRGIYLSFIQSAGTDLNTAKFREYLNAFDTYVKGFENPGYGEKIRELKPEIFHRLMEILYVDSCLFDHTVSTPQKCFTGRKIIHLAISGYKTMGNKKEYDPARNLFELFHLFPLLAEGNQAASYETLAHVVAKKSLWSEYAMRPMERLSTTSSQQKSIRRVGRIFPFPSQSGGKHWWYYVDGLLNDGGGDVNYALVPCCKGYMLNVADNPATGIRAPLIKLYRSTASDPEAESSIDSLLADTNPNQIGSPNFKKGDEYENAYFDRCTMPLWTAYLVIGDIDGAVNVFKDIAFTPLEDISLITTEAQKRTYLVNFLAWQIGEFSQDRNPLSLKNRTSLAQMRVSEFEKKLDAGLFSHYLTQTLEGKEWELSKLAQNIYFVGHSLGAALVQEAIFHFGPDDHRIPLVGCHFKCFAYDPPGVSMKTASKFLDFGRQNQELMVQLRQKWEIEFHFEFQDIVPQGGACFLGAQGYKRAQDESWLKISSQICKPKDSATDLVMTTLPTHGRRFQHLIKAGESSNLNCEWKSLSISELVNLKRDWFLSEALRQTFGFKWTTPFLSETLLRRGIPGFMAHTYYTIKKALYPMRAPLGYEVDKEGVLFCTYKGYTALANP